MHILFTTYEFVTERKPCGGMGHYLANISTILAQHGHEVTILLLSDRNKQFDWKKNIKVVKFQYKYANNGINTGEIIDKLFHINQSYFINRSLAFKKKIQEINKEKKIDIVQNNGDHLECWYRCRNIPTVVRLSSFTPWYQYAYNPKNDMNDKRWLYSIDSKIFVHPLKNADAIYGPSRCVAEFVNEYLIRKVQVIESPFLLENITQKIQLPEEIQGKKYYLFFGRICVLKGVDAIISSIYQILKENTDCCFVFAGPMEQAGFADRIVHAAAEYKKRVIFLGEIKEKGLMQEIIRNAEACILPSRADNLPNSCIEAMGLGKIVIGTYGASFEQLIKNKYNGFLIRRDSSKALLNAIRYLNRMSPEEKKIMGERAVERIDKMNSEIIYGQLIHFYQDVINKRRGL